MEKQERKRRGEEVDDTDGLVTALDYEDTWKKSAEGFVPASINNVTDTKSVKREMDRPLRLLAKYKHGSEIHWDLPFTAHADSETLRETAVRAIKERVGDNLSVQVMGNTPWSFHKYKYPKHYQEKVNRLGAKVWIFKGILLNSFNEDANVILEDGLLDYQWATREEMKELLDKKIYRAIDNMLHDEN